MVQLVISFVKLIKNRIRVNMVRNNIEIDVKVKCIEEGTTPAAVAEQLETTKSYTFVQMMEALGYDIELHYVKRNGK